MIPIGDRLSTRTTPYVNIAIILANFVLFFYELTLNTQATVFSPSELDVWFQDWGAVPACITDALGLKPDVDPRAVAVLCDGDRTLITPFSAMFMHAGWLHILGNMLFLWVFGDNVEDALGHVRYLVFYLVVGSGVARALLERGEAYGRQVGCPLRLLRILEQEPDRERPVRVDRALFTQDIQDIIGNPAIDIVIEVLGGENPAYEYQRQALEAGKYVVTANKEVIAKHGVELRALAHERGVDILYEASVGGGIPIIAPLKRDLLANEITAISAIINGTTNYILTCMSREGSDFEPALRRAQELGYAEANPASDIEGMDAAYKLAILASLAFHADIRPEDVYREGITRLIARDFRYARELGYAIKLLALARKHDSQLQVRVHPVLLHEDELLAKVDGVLNAVQVEGDLVGRVLFQGQGAGSLPTSSAIVADVLDAARSVVGGPPERRSPSPQEAASVRPMSELRTRYYMRMMVADSPGVLGRIARVLGDHQISIASVIQKEADKEAQTAEIVIMTHEAQEEAVQQALQEVERLPMVVEIGNFLRVEG